VLETVEADGRRLTYGLTTASAGAVIARLAGVAALRDVAVLEPDIEDVVARLYGDGGAAGQGCSISSTPQDPAASAR
jgi:ABC-2 type transport system ATP-binding protein